MNGTTLNGKRFEVEARKERFLDVARTLLLEDGYEAVTIAHVAEVTGFSRGTVYQAFSTREDLVTALGMACRVRLLESVARGAAFDGRPREKLVAVGVSIAAYSDAHPHDQRILKMIDAEAILERVSEEDRRTMRGYDVGIFRLLQGIAEEAVASGDLVLRPGLTTEGLCFAFWTMMDGAFAAFYGGAPLEEIGVPNPLDEVIRSGHCLMDGYGWHPLSTDWDYDRSTRNAQRIFNGDAAPVGRFRTGNGAGRLARCS